MLELKQEILDVLNDVIESKGCPFFECKGCDPDCICRMFNNSETPCYEIAKKIKEALKND